jgi:hypothetical protein
MKQSEVHQIIKDEITKYISEVIAAHVVNETIKSKKRTIKKGKQ